MRAAVVVGLLFLESNDGVTLKVGHVNSSSLDFDCRMLLGHEPSHVGKEEPSLGIMRVGIGLGIFVMDAVVPAPLVDRVLECDRLEQGQEELERKFGLVGLVSPETVTPGRDSESTHKVKQSSWTGKTEQ